MNDDAPQKIILQHDNHLSFAFGDGGSGSEDGGDSETGTTTQTTTKPPIATPTTRSQASPLTKAPSPFGSTHEQPSKSPTTALSEEDVFDAGEICSCYQYEHLYDFFRVQHQSN